MPSPRETVGLTVCVKETRSQTFKTLKPFIFSICCDGYSFYIADPEERPVCLLQRWKDCLTLRRVTLPTVILMSWAFQCIKNPVYESCPLMPACGFLMPENDTSWLHASWSCLWTCLYGPRALGFSPWILDVTHFTLHRKEQEIICITLALQETASSTQNSGPSEGFWGFGWLPKIVPQNSREFLVSW